MLAYPVAVMITETSAAKPLPEREPYHPSLAKNQCHRKSHSVARPNHSITFHTPPSREPPYPLLQNSGTQ